ncbi:hypothetical protein [Thiorhodococcus minor]|uniref:Hsp70 family protein n=1 Tax=Thiorhodococcus minor TaxID=57489 RepID=A0A6M0K162_9GAMM|nr:hypothetical protein [Thiorhodococcus minor]NEV62347.1 hypothetical protein [Thiorhodococcus minor]
MELVEAKILIKNLLKRVRAQEDGSKQLTGVLTDDELEALQFALTLLDGPAPSSSVMPTSTGVTPAVTEPSPPKPMAPITEFVPPEPKSDDVPPPPRESAKPAKSVEPKRTIELDLSALTAPKPPANVRLCLDFGTAMSKVTLVEDGEDPDLDEEVIEVLSLGKPGDQEEVSETMLISSVYIDNDGVLWFGKAAVDRSMIEGQDGSRQRLDNIKRRLSEDGWDEDVGERYNPTGIRVTHGDMVLAYLMYLTWTVNGCLEELGYPWNLPRRFAMPCLSGEKGRETVHRLSRAVGEAQVLADTFYRTLKDGIPLEEFVAAVRLLREKPREYPFVAEDITEPLGVAGSLMSWQAPVDMLIMVVDVGAGTSDLSLFRIHFNPNTGKNVALEVEDASRGIQVAGNHLDRMLIELLVKKSGVTSEEPMWLNVRSALELQIRDLKESLFNDGSVFVPLLNGTEVIIELDEFMQLDPVRRFGRDLRATMVEILESIDESWVKWVTAHPNRRLVVALTGGGSELPMVKELAEGFIQVDGLSIPLVRALAFPNWLRDLDEGLEADYPRIAVSLGGARRRLIQRGPTARITAGDVTQAPTLGGYYSKGN